MKQVAILSYEGCWAMGLFSAADFFLIAALLERHLGVEQSFAVRVVSVDGAPVRAAGGHIITAEGALADVEAASLPPNLYLQQVRIDKAKKLLLATQLKVRDIAAEVGYENVSFFVRLFKTRVGTTPARWREGAT